MSASFKNNPDHVHETRLSESGNLLFIILLAVVLIGTLTAVITQSGDGDGATIDNENLAIKVSEVQRFGSELERGILFLMQNGISESDIRFAHPDNNADYGDLTADPDKSDQMFHIDGGGATFREPPSGINDGSSWEFYGTTRIPSVGTDRADLIVLLPNVTEAFCRKVNDVNGYGALITILLEDDATCINSGAGGRFDAGTQFSGAPNTVADGTFPQNGVTGEAQPTPQGCVTCDDKTHHFYHVIMAR